MELTKAIEDLSDSAHRRIITFDKDHKDAQLLGIQAMIAILAWRRDWQGDRFHQLPGETPSDAPGSPATLFSLGY